MKVYIDKDIFKEIGSSMANRDEFNELLGMVPYRCDIGTIQSINDDDLDKLDHIEKIRFVELLGKCNNKIDIAHDSDCIVTLNGESEFYEREFGLSEVCEYVSFGARIVLEDATNDGFFIKAIEKYFDEALDFERLVAKDIVIIDNAGGSGTKRRVDEFIRNHHGKPKFLRCLVIVDGDCRYPDDQEYENYDKQRDERKYFNERGVRYYVLNKRAQENYMPDIVFDSNRDKFGDEWVSAYLSLSPQQKDHYCIAAGFYKDIPKVNRDNDELEYDKLPQKIQMLFNSVSPGNYHHLLHGPNLHGSFKSEFPKFFNDPHVCKTALYNRVNHPDSVNPNELMHIIEEIRQLL